MENKRLPRQNEIVRRFGEMADSVSMPSNVDAERAMLGSILLNNDLFEEAREKLTAEDFFLSSHKRIFRAFDSLKAADMPFDMVTVLEWLSRENQMEAVGGAEYVGELASAAVHLTTISHYIKIIRGKSLLRQIIMSASAMIGEAFSSGSDPEEVLAEAEQTILEIGDRALSSTLQPMQDLASDVVLKLNTLIERGEHVTGVSTDFTRLDELTSGLQPSDFVILAARPSVGKTALALCIAYNVAKSGKTTAFFSLEMSAEQVFFRLLSMASRINLQQLRTGRLTKADQAKAAMKIDELATTQLFIDDSSVQTVLDLGAKLRRLKKNHGLDLVLVDYIGLMRGAGRYENRNLEVSSISRGLKALAKDLQVPVVGLSQLSRASEKRGEGKTPLLSDLRDSGSLEQDADVVLFLHRTVRAKDDDPDAAARAKLIIAKQRNGPTDSLELIFLDSRAQFVNPAQEQAGGPPVD